MPLAPQLSARLYVLLQEVSDLEATAMRQSDMLDRTFDLHNDLTEWAVNTEHGDAALEVMAVLDRYVAACKIPNTLGDSDAASLSQALSPDIAG